MKIQKLIRFGLSLTLGLAAFTLPLDAAKGGKGKPGGDGGGDGGGSTPPPNPVIVVNDNDQLVGMNDDGSNRYTIANAGTDRAAPTWSPDGTRIAYFESPGRRLMIAEANGSAPPVESGGGWSDWWDTHGVGWAVVQDPNHGTVEVIVYSNEIDPDPHSLWAVNLDGPQAGLPYQLRNVLNTRSQDPDWLPDGRLSFVAWEVGFYDDQRLVVADVVMENGRLELASETDMTVVLGAQGLDLPGDLNFVQWANQSAKFAFSSGDEFGSSSIYVVDLTGSTPTMTRMPKSASNQHCWAADWSGNDAYLVYEGFAQKKIKGGVYKIASDGSSSPVYLGRGVRPCWWSGDVQP